MKKILAIISLAFTLLLCYAADTLYIQGRVKDAVSKFDLTKAYVVLFDSVGNPKDTIKANQGFRWNGSGVDTVSEFYFEIPAVDTTLVFDVECPGYQVQTISYPVTNVKKRERYRELPLIYLSRAVNQLKELNVTSSKIKFYHDGDTLVYNADAFQLAEGSMLDALIAQLPGAELNSNGQIKVNGEFVESLLLNGKEFMNDNKVMLENIGAYTVKNIKVFEQATKRSKELGLDMNKVLTMDVHLKKEYSMGWLVNAQAGAGTEDRYMGRAFVNWFTATTRLTLTGLINNLNDNRTPGKNDTWTPEQMPTGTKRVKGINLAYENTNAEETKEFEGRLAFSVTDNNTYTSTDRLNFLPDYETYDKSFSLSKFRETHFDTWHSFSREANKRLVFGGYLNATYHKTKDAGSDISGTFSEELQGITTEVLEALYSGSNSEAYNKVINRSATRSDGWSKKWNFGAMPRIGFDLTGAGDRLTFYTNVSYSSSKHYSWRDYEINYGQDPVAAVKRRQYTEGHPNHTLNVTPRFNFGTKIAEGAYMYASYFYDFTDNVKDSYLYSLERLSDMGIYGVLPDDYTATLDPANSYTSRLISNSQNLNLSIYGWKEFKELYNVNLSFSPQLQYMHRHLFYWRNNSKFSTSADNFTVTFQSIWNCRLEFGRFKKSKDEGKGRRSYLHHFRYSYTLTPTLPDMVDMLDIVDDSNPLNIYYGNPDLKTSNYQKHLLRWQWNPVDNLTNVLYAGYSYTSNALTRGYTYDTETGIRYNRMYNVGGNHTTAFTNEFDLQFGPKKQFTISSYTDVNMARLSDMIGVNKEAPDLYKVNNNTFTENVKLSWRFGNQSIQLRGDFTNRHTTSQQEGFNNINANHLIYGLSGVFSLPAGFGISTDFMCYMRRGYGSADLDTTDPVWNARLTYTPVKHKRWVFMLDGFDLLHKLTNVKYSVTATGRTVAYTNTIPRYLLFSVQYRLSIQPKR